MTNRFYHREPNNSKKVICILRSYHTHLIEVIKEIKTSISLRKLLFSEESQRKVTK